MHGQDVSLAVRTHTPRVHPHGNGNVPPHRLRYDTAYIARKEALIRDQTTRGIPCGEVRDTPDPAKLQFPREQAQRSPGQERASRPARAQRPPITGIPATSSSHTFPIPTLPTRAKASRALETVIESLNMLYLGPNHIPPPSTARTDLARIPTTSALLNISRILHTMCYSPASRNSLTASLALKTATNIADLPSYQLFPALEAVFSDPDISLQRGLFQRIQADNIDLPSARPLLGRRTRTCGSGVCLNRLDRYSRAQPLLSRRQLWTTSKSAKTNGALPQARLYASEQEYAALLGKAEDDGLLHWSLVSEEDNQYSTLATDIEMTLFAVFRSGHRSRLISRPRVQNEAMPPPRCTSLPNPSMFEAIRMHGASPGAFFLDIYNIFHNITLPLWLSRLLPMKPIPLSNLSTDTQQRISHRKPIPADARDILLRSCQAKIPMGFKWAVYIAHTFVSTCFDEAFHLLKSSRMAIPSMVLSKRRAEEAPFLLSKLSPLLLQIINDAACITVGWPPQLVTAWHKLVRRVLRLNLLPVAGKKSSNPWKVVEDSISFIGCN